MFEDLESKIAEFYKMSDSENQSLLKELNTRINSNPKKFKNFMNQIGYGYESDRAVYYEAVAKHNPNQWKDYLYDELAALIRAAESGNEDATDELDSIEWLVNIEGMDDSFYNKTRKLLFSKLNSNTTEVREYTLTSLVDIFDLSKVKPNALEIEKLRNCLQDSSFKNKMYAYAELRDLKLLPKDFKFTMVEKIKIKLQGYSSLYNR